MLLVRCLCGVCALCQHIPEWVVHYLGGVLQAPLPCMGRATAANEAPAGKHGLHKGLSSRRQ